MEFLYSAVLLGLMGSFHCVGMCGPIAISLPLRGNNFFEKLTGGILYNTGRSLMYGVMGMFFGFIGQGFEMVGFQKWISILMGLLMLVSVLAPFLIRKWKINTDSVFTKWLRNSMNKMFQQRSYSGLFTVGLLNALLPCGLVYLAIAGAIVTGNALTGAFYMILFGLGTIPMMLTVSMVGNLAGFTFRKRINQAIPYLVVVVGVIFVLRGLTLGIPYLSPPIDKLTPKYHTSTSKTHEPSVTGSCCHKK